MTHLERTVGIFNVVRGNHHNCFIYQEPTYIQIPLAIQYANLIPARQGGAIILPASQHINHHLPAGIRYYLSDLHQLASFKLPHYSFIFELND